MEQQSTDAPRTAQTQQQLIDQGLWLADLAIIKQGALHNPGELTALMRILYYMRPETILEIGTYAGGSAWAWARIRSVRHIVTVDLAPQPEAAERLLGLPCRATQITGDSTDGNTQHAVKEALDGLPPNVVVIDGAHDYRSARRDWELYGQLVPSGGLVVLHDTQGYPGNDTVQVPLLWNEIRQHYRCTELVDKPGGPGGTGIVWI